MKFLFFSAQYLPTIGGVERYTNSLARELIKQGHQAVVVTSSLQGKPAEEISPEGIQVYRIPVKWMMNNRFSIPIFNKSFHRIAQKIKQENCDFAVIQTKFYLNSVWAAKFCKKNNIPAIVVEHGSAHLLRKGIVGAIGSFYEHMAARYIYNQCPNFYGVSQASCQWLTHFNIKAKGCLYNAVNPQELQELANASQKTHLKDIDFRVPTICFSGRFIPEKGVENLVQAFVLLKQTIPSVQLVMAGDGELWDKINQQHIPDLFLTGNLPYEENLALIQNSTIFCLPTFSEGFSTSILEAAALKTFIITTATGGSPQLLPTAEYGTILSSTSPACILNALIDALTKKTLLMAATDNTYQHLQQQFTWTPVSHTLLEIYNAIKD